MELTLSVRSFQVPATPRACAWPPNLPSVPTSRATRDTSEANAFSSSTMVLRVFFSSRISPLTSTVIFFDKSPLATAVATAAMLRTWPVRFDAIELTLSVKSFQVPATPPTKFVRPFLISKCRTLVITSLNAEGGVAGISLVPQRYQCGHCNMWLNMQDEPEHHIDLCVKQQKKIERHRELLQ